MIDRPDTEKVLRGLKDFQRATVEHVAALRAMGIDDATIVDLVRRSVG